MKKVNCANCGILFGISDALYAKRASDGKMFACPNGHEQHFSDNAESQLRKEIRTLKSHIETRKKRIKFWRDQYERVTRQLSATKGVVTKLRKELGR